MTLLKPTIQVRRLIALQGGHRALDIEFHRGVNVIRGRNSSGKTTVMDILAYSLGAESIRWKPEALLCSQTIVEVKLNTGLACFKRDIEAESQQPMDIYWGPLEEAINIPEHGWTRYPFRRSLNKINFSQAIFSALDMPIAQGDGASNLTMHQILRVLYADQPSVHSPIFRMDAWDSTLTREMIGSYLAGVFDDDLYSAQLRVRDLDSQLNKATSELKGIFNILGRTGNSPGLMSAEDKLAELERERDELSGKLADLRSGQESSGSKLAKNSTDKTRLQLSKARQSLSVAKDEISSLELDIADSNLFINELRARLDGLNEASLTRDHLSGVIFDFCPCCLAELEPPTSDGDNCHLCKKPLGQNDSAASQLLRMRNELDLQIKESQNLLVKRAGRLELLKSNLPELEEQAKRLTASYNAEIRSVVTEIESQSETIARRLGAIDEEIQQTIRFSALLSAISDLQRNRDSLNSERLALLDKIEGLEAQQEARKSQVSAEIESAMTRLLGEDLPLQPEFIDAESASVNFVDNEVYVNGSKNFSESSAVVLRHIFHLSLLTASTKLDYMRVPRFMMLDGIDDGGMEKERSHRLQKIIVTECSSYEAEFQLIFATSEIAPELEGTQLVTGRYFDPANRSLDIRTLPS